jgi:signal transduction histidine kinase
MEKFNVNGLNFIINNNNEILKNILLDDFITIYTMVVNMNNLILYSSSEMSNFLNENITSKKVSDIIKKSEFKKFRKNVLECAFTEKIVEDELFFREKEFKFKFVPISENNKIEFILISFYSTTKTKKIEKEIELIKDKLKISSSINSIFLSNISHELKTPLNSIIGFSDILLQTNQSESQIKKFLKSININGKHLYEMISNIIDASILESDNYDILYK